jgi:translation initiation factor IF-3
MVDYGKFRYEQAKRERESRRHQHANKVKEIQLSPAIDAHDFEIKLGHAIDFLCDDIKLKVTLRFRGREMTHQELGQQVVEKFISLVSPYGHPDAPPRLVGKGIVVMLSPLPRNKRAKNPRLDQAGRPALPEQENFRRPLIRAADLPGQAKTTDLAKQTSAAQAAQQKTSGFLNNPFAQLEEKLGGLSD